MKYNNFELITIIAIYTFIFPFSVQAQLMSDGSFESAGSALGSGNPFLAYPSFTNDWTTVNVDGEVFNDGNAFDGNWYADLLQNAGQNLNTFWDEANHTSSGYDRILTSITDLTPNTEYMVIFYHSTQLNRYGYLADQTLVQIQSVQTQIIHIQIIQIHIQTIQIQIIQIQISQTQTQIQIQITCCVVV